MTEALKLENLSAGYESDVILSRINLSVGKGDMIGVIGPNGSGKSTLLKTIRGLLPKLAGQIYLFGKRISEYRGREFALTAAYLQQDVRVTFGYTVRDIVMLGRYPHIKWWEQETSRDENIVERCMECVGILGLAETAINNISGGQKQRTLLAKILAQQTPFLFLDEPTSGLDIVYQEELLRFCMDLRRAGKTILVILHDLTLAAKYCSSLALLGQGKLIAYGTTPEVLTDKNLSAAYGVPMHVTCNPQSGRVETVLLDHRVNLTRDFGDLL